MGPIYAGVLGPMAASFVLLRAVKDGGAPESAFLIGAVSLVVFAVIGYIVGAVAQRTVEDSVHAKYRTALAKAQANRQSAEETKEVEKAEPAQPSPG